MTRPSACRVPFSHAWSVPLVALGVVSWTMASAQPASAAASGTGAAAAVAPALILAGSSADASAANTQPVLGEIVVTASKRRETVLATPISITAITGASIQSRGPADFRSLLETVPGVSAFDQGPGQTQYEIRGVDGSAGNSPTTGLYLADIPLTAPAGANNGKVVIDPALYDLNRVEVLRGPQGTLYGASSMGGAIRLIPNAPDLRRFDVTAQGIGSYTDGGGANGTLNAMVNLPLVDDKAALRVVGTQKHDSGWIDRDVIAPGDFPFDNGVVRGDVLNAPVQQVYHDENYENLTAGRASLLVEPTKSLQITPMVLYQRIYMGMTNIIDRKSVV